MTKSRVGHEKKTATDEVNASPALEISIEIRSNLHFIALQMFFLSSLAIVASHFFKGSVCRSRSLSLFSSLELVRAEFFGIENFFVCALDEFV
jgi:hypothetical protein